MISIVIPYYNRKQLLINTLKSINYFSGGVDIETIIVDDGSDDSHLVSDTIDMFPNLYISVILVHKDSAAWRAPAIAYNIGFNEARGDIILLNSSDCIHAGDILGFVNENLKNKMYFSFATLAAMEGLNDYFNNTIWDDQTINVAQSHFCFQNGWWRCHSTNRTLIPFCAAINKSDLELLSGYDERFASGIGYDDCDFIDRVYNAGVSMQLIDSPYCIHQYHDLVQYTNESNKELLERLVREEPNRVKAPNNYFYVR